MNGHVVSLQLTPGQDPPQSPPELSQSEENSFSQPAVPTSPSQQGNTHHNSHALKIWHRHTNISDPLRVRFLFLTILHYVTLNVQLVVHKTTYCHCLLTYRGLRTFITATGLQKAYSSVFKTFVLLVFLVKSIESRKGSELMYRTVRRSMNYPE